MGFVQRELERVTAKLQAGPLPADEYGKLYAIQQALAWSLEPTGFKAPYAMVSSTPSEPKDCLEGSDRSPSSNSLGHHAS